MRTERLFAILLYLLSSRKLVQAKTLAEQFEVSVRSIYRDLDTLAASGVPIYAVNGRKGGYTILEQFALSRFTFSEVEKQQLQEALELLGKFDQVVDLANLQHKITLLQTEEVAKSKTTALQLTHHHQDIVEEIEKKKAIFHQVIEAAGTIDITYVSTHQAPVQRKIQPQQLLFAHGSWYVEAYCYEREAMRQFKLTRVVDMDHGVFMVTEPILQPDAILDVVFKKENYAYLLDFFAQATLQLEDSGVRVRTILKDFESILTLLFMFDPVQIIAPRELKTAYREKLTNLLKADI